MKTLRICIVALLAVSSMAMGSLVNPSFEQPTSNVVDPVNGYNQFFADFTQIPGWDLMQGDAGLWAHATANGATDGTTTAYLGTQTSSRPTGAISQLMTYLIKGPDKYELSFSMWAYNVGSGVRAELFYLDQATRVTFLSEDFTVTSAGAGNVAPFKLMSDAPVPLGAVGKQLGLQLTAIDDQNREGVYIDLDNFVLAIAQFEAPEPATVCTLLVGATVLLRRKLR